MTLILALLVGFLFAVGVYLLLERSIVRMVLGLVFLSYAATLLLFVAGGLVRGKLPLVPSGLTAPPAGASDPVPQALILTAIVIGFGTLAFSAVLVSRIFKTGDDDADRLGPEAERLGEDEES
jgi:multicomponent Na+:H+ antiporter subunit C